MYVYTNMHSRNALFLVCLYECALWLQGHSVLIMLSRMTRLTSNLSLTHTEYSFMALTSP